MAEAATKRKGGGKLRDRRSRSNMIGKRIALLLIVTVSCSLGVTAPATAQSHPSPASEPPFAISPSPTLSIAPRFQLEAGQVQDIMAYLKTLEQ